MTREEIERLAVAYGLAMSGGRPGTTEPAYAALLSAIDRLQRDLETQAKTIEAMRKAIVVRLELLEAYLDMGDISSVRSVIDAWKDAARSEGGKP